MVYYDVYESPMGPLLLESDGVFLTGLFLNRKLPETAAAAEALPVFGQAKAWLDSYFRGERKAVDVPLKTGGTAFQQAVWELLTQIPWGETATYGAIAAALAKSLGKERMSARAVGQAVGKNPVCILIPCHRCVGAGGKLTGYAGGLDKKIWLLRHEGWPGDSSRTAERG